MESNFKAYTVSKNLRKNTKYYYFDKERMLNDIETCVDGFVLPKGIGSIKELFEMYRPKFNRIMHKLGITVGYEVYEPCPHFILVKST